jgi:indolepyruvate ferredoxin oxidoreductase beta subunit
MMDNQITNVLIAGVGGQGVLLVSEILSLACLKGGQGVKKSEVHGMAQRGGSVVSHVRFGKRVQSPLIERGTAHVLVALEELEALRWSGLLAPDGVIIMNTQRISPLPVAVGLQQYPREITARLRQHAGRLVTIDAVGLARQAGNIRSVNITMLGALTAHLGLKPEIIRGIIRSRLPRKTYQVNAKAFQTGMNAYLRSVSGKRSAAES